MWGFEWNRLWGLKREISKLWTYRYASKRKNCWDWDSKIEICWDWLRIRVLLQSVEENEKYYSIYRFTKNMQEGRNEKHVTNKVSQYGKIITLYTN